MARPNGNAFLPGVASSIILHLKLPIIVTAHIRSLTKLLSRDPWRSLPAAASRDRPRPNTPWRPGKAQQQPSTVPSAGGEDCGGVRFRLVEHRNFAAFVVVEDPSGDHDLHLFRKLQRADVEDSARLVCVQPESLISEPRPPRPAAAARDQGSGTGWLTLFLGRARPFQARIPQVLRRRRRRPVPVGLFPLRVLPRRGARCRGCS